LLLTNTEAISHEEFIDRIAPYAQELQKGYGILPSIIIGQAILESDWGQSSLASEIFFFHKQPTLFSY